jgi:hypothetical protein
LTETETLNTEDTFDFPIPAPLPPPPERLVAVGRHGTASVEAEDFSRRLGNWGGASHLIGNRWEALAPTLLRRRLPWTLPAGGGRVMTIVAVLALDADPVAGSALQRAGVSASDLLLIGQMPRGTGTSGLLVRAADCKVSLDTADPVQTTPVRLQATFDRIREAFPQVVAALQRQVVTLTQPAQESAALALGAAVRGAWHEVLAGEGLFVAPESGFNRWFLAQLEERRRTGAPLGRLPASGPRRPASETRGPVGPAQLARLTLPAHLESVSAEEFLGSLPGWPAAGVIAELDGQALASMDVSVAERCWRVGAGLRGAILALRRPLFRPMLESVRPDGRPRDLAHLLREVAVRRRMVDSTGLIATVSRSLDQRRPLWQRETAVLQMPLSFGAFVGQLGEARRAAEAPAPEARDGLLAEGSSASGVTASSGVARATARTLYRELSQQHRRRVLAAAVALAREGHDEATILDALEERLPEWRAAAEAAAQAAVG